MRINSRTAVNAWRSLLGSASSGSSLFSPLPFTSLVVDPANVSGNASDTGAGSLAQPLLTTAQANQRLLGKLTGATSIQYLSDDVSGVGLDLSHLIQGGFGLSVTGTTQLLHTGGTINAGTLAINPLAAGGGQRQTVHTTDLATFAPFVFTGLGGAAANPTRLIDSNGGTAWIASGAATASMSRPVNDAVSAPGALTIGDSYTVVRGSILTLANTPAPSSTGGTITFKNFAFTATSVGPQPASSIISTVTFVPTQVVFVHCSFLNYAAINAVYNNCFAAQDFAVNGTTSVAAGVLVTTFAGASSSGIIEMSGDVYITGTTFVNGGGLYDSVTITAGLPFGSGVQVQDMAGGSPAFLVRTGATANINGLIWGNGNSGVGLSVDPSSGLDLAGNIPSVTGAGGDFDFNGVALGRAWNNAVGAYTEAGGPATRTTTWAHFVATIAAGGFAGQAHAPDSNSHLTSI